MSTAETRRPRTKEYESREEAGQSPVNTSRLARSTKAPKTKTRADKVKSTAPSTEAHTAIDGETLPDTQFDGWEFAIRAKNKRKDGWEVERVLSVRGPGRKEEWTEEHETRLNRYLESGSFEKVSKMLGFGEDETFLKTFFNDTSENPLSGRRAISNLRGLEFSLSSRFGNDKTFSSAWPSEWGGKLEYGGTGTEEITTIKRGKTSNGKQYVQTEKKSKSKSSDGVKTTSQSTTKKTKTEDGSTAPQNRKKASKSTAAKKAKRKKKAETSTPSSEPSEESVPSVETAVSTQQPSVASTAAKKVKKTTETETVSEDDMIVPSDASATSADEATKPTTKNTKRKKRVKQTETTEDAGESSDGNSSATSSGSDSS